MKDEMSNHRFDSILIIVFTAEGAPCIFKDRIHGFFISKVKTMKAYAHPCNLQYNPGRT